MAIKEITIPDMGGADQVDVIEVLVKPGDQINKEQSLITLESEKASMEIPSPFAGKVVSLAVKVGDKVSEGGIILTLETAENEAKTTATNTATTTSNEIKAIKVPDIGGASNVEVIEVLVKPGDQITKEQSLITLESEKASMEIPSPYSGIVKEVKIKLHDKISEGDVILILQTSAETKITSTSTQVTAQTAPAVPAPPLVASSTTTTTTTQFKSGEVHAGPGVRQMARELGVDLTRVKGSGPKNRITKEDVQAFVKSELQKAQSGGLNVPAASVIDFTKFGEIESKALNKIKRLTGVNVHRSWITVPHVTQFEEADITELEQFRQSQKAEAEKHGVKLTPLVFIMKAVVTALKEFPIFNSSLDASGENLIYKKYFNIGVAVDTPNGLVVPVIRKVDCKSLFELAKELADISKKAREKGLTPAEMSGGCFTISSLGGIGGNAFTPIVNTPEVAILGVSRAAMKPVYQDNQFVPRLMLPLSLSYDHRVIDGADGARFAVFLAKHLTDVKTLML